MVVIGCSSRNKCLEGTREKSWDENELIFEMAKKIKETEGSRYPPAGRAGNLKPTEEDISIFL